MNKRLIAAVVIVGLFLLFVTFNANKDNSNVTKYRADYMSTCAVDSKLKAYCTCSFNYLLDTYGESGILKMSIKYAKDGVITNEMYDAAFKCAHEIK